MRCGQGRNGPDRHASTSASARPGASGREVVQRHDPVQMVHLVLRADRGEARQKVSSRSVPSSRGPAQPHLGGPRHLGRPRRGSTGSLPARSRARPTRQRISGFSKITGAGRPVFPRHIHHEQPRQNPHLRRRQPAPGCGIHRLEHVGGQRAAAVRPPARTGAQRARQPGVGPAQDRHGPPSDARALTRAPGRASAFPSCG